MTPLEKAARAVTEARAYLGSKPGRTSDVDRRVARAVLLSLRDATPEMIEAGDAVDGTITSAAVWRAMINTITGEG